MAKLAIYILKIYIWFIFFVSYGINRRYSGNKVDAYICSFIYVKIL